jgi:high-affinity nickel-transport protein
MAVLTTVIGLPFLVSRAKSERINRWLTVSTGLLSIVFGLYLAYQIGFVDGLFTGDYHWEPT